MVDDDIIIENGHKLIIETPSGGDSNVKISAITVGPDPILFIDRGIKGYKDLNLFGFVGVSTDEQKIAGGAAIMMGHGFTGSTDPPRISLTDSELVNQIRYSENFLNGVWTAYDGSKTNVTNGYLCPDNTNNTAYKFQQCGQSGGCRGCWQSSSPSLQQNQKYTVSIWLKGTYDNQPVMIGLNDTYHTTVNLTTTWKRYFYTITIPQGGSTSRGLQFNSGITGDTYYAWGGQLELVALTDPDGYHRSYVKTESTANSKFDTLYLYGADGSTQAHLDLGNLTAHGTLNVDGNLTSSGIGTFYQVMSKGAGAELYFDDRANADHPFIWYALSSHAYLWYNGANIIDFDTSGNLTISGGFKTTNNTFFGVNNAANGNFPCALGMWSAQSATYGGCVFLSDDWSHQPIFTWYGSRSGNRLMALDASGNLFINSAIYTINGAAIQLIADTVVGHANTVYSNINSTNSGSVAFNLQSGGSTKGAFGYDSATSKTYLIAYTNGSTYSQLHLLGSKIVAENDTEFTAGVYINKSQPFLIMQHSGSDRLAIGYDTSHTYVNVTNGGNLDFVNNNGSIAFTASTGKLYVSYTQIVPNNAGTCTVGNPSGYDDGKYFSHSAAYTVYGHSSGYFDAYDDLALVKQWGEKTPTIPSSYNGEMRPKDDDPFSMMRGKASKESDFFDLMSVCSFALGCVKALVKKQDESDKILLEVVNEKEKMSREITDLREQLQKLAIKEV